MRQAGMNQNFCSRSAPVLVDVLHQQAPVRCRQCCEIVFGEGAELQLPGIIAALLDHQSRIDLVAAGQPAQALGRDEAAKTGQGLADQQRFLLPVFPQEGTDAKSAQQCRRRR